MKVMWFVYIMIGNVLWSISDVWASVFINRVHKNPFVVGWYLAVLDLIVLACATFIIDLDTAWAVYIGAAALLAFVGTMALYTVLSYVDASVSSVAWVFLSIGIAVGGFVFFGDSWSLYQSIGAVLSVGGVCLLSLWKLHVSSLSSYVLLALTGLLYVPYFLVSKAAFIAGVSPITILFWYMLFHALYGLVIPLTMKKVRRGIAELYTSTSVSVLRWCFPRTLITFLATYVVLLAYQSGDASLVGIAENGQPFFLIFFAWFASYLVPQYAPRELLTAQSVSIKLISFCIVFAGLSLLAVG